MSCAMWSFSAFRRPDSQHKIQSNTHSQSKEWTRYLIEPEIVTSATFPTLKPQFPHPKTTEKKSVKNMRLKFFPQSLTSKCISSVTGGLCRKKKNLAIKKKKKFSHKCFHFSHYIRRHFLDSPHMLPWLRITTDHHTWRKSIYFC